MLAIMTISASIGNFAAAPRPNLSTWVFSRDGDDLTNVIPFQVRDKLRWCGPRDLQAARCRQRQLGSLFKDRCETAHQVADGHSRRHFHSPADQ
jgi:hypothetical protein